MRRLGAACALALAAAAPVWGDADSADLQACAASLKRSLEVMEAAPLLKEEVATGLMWLRLDAETALEAGDAPGCLERARTVESILGLTPAKG